MGLIFFEKKIDRGPEFACDSGWFLPVFVTGTTAEFWASGCDDISIANFFFLTA